MAIIYQITNTINNKSYIGLTTKGLEHRWAGHCHKANYGSKFHIHRAIRKYGASSFTCVVLEETTQDQMNDRERYWISTKRPEYNMTVGGEGKPGCPVSDDTRRKMSIAQSGPNNPCYGVSPSQGTRAKISASLKGKLVSEQTRAKLSAALAGKTRISGKNNPRYGMTHTQKTKSVIASKIRAYFSTRKIRWVNKDGKNKRIPEDQINEYIGTGWSSGMCCYRTGQTPPAQSSSNPI